MADLCEARCRDGARCAYEALSRSPFCYYHDKKEKGYYDRQPIEQTPERAIRQLVQEWDLTGF
jgi:hypothetical protein